MPLMLALVVHLVMLAIINIFVSENAKLKKKLGTIMPSLAKEDQNIQSFMPSLTDKPFTSKMPREFIQSNLTVIIFNDTDGNDHESFHNQLNPLKKEFPSPFLWNEEKEHLGKSLNRLISRVKTEYFLFLEPCVLPSDRPQEGISLLWDALEQFPELDFVAGSYLSKDKLHVPFHRFRLCRWTFSESYEYLKSLDNLMICEGTQDL